ncbi:MAG: hypothetical protein ACK53V_01560, partial [Planctomycetota bacterium]
FAGNHRGLRTYNVGVYLITLFDGSEAMFDFDDFDDDDFFTAIWYYARSGGQRPHRKRGRARDSAGFPGCEQRRRPKLKDRVQTKQ